LFGVHVALVNVKWLIASNVITALIVTVLVATMVFASFTSYNIYLDALPRVAQYTIEDDGAGTYRAIKYNGQALFSSTNSSEVINDCIAVMTSGTIFLMANVPIDETTIDAHPSIRIDGEYGFNNGGSIASCANGTWIEHGLNGDPATTGSITLSLRGPSAYNATFILRVPTVLESNSTHFQVEFLAWDPVTWDQVPVGVAEGQTIWWDATYKP